MIGRVLLAALLAGVAAGFIMGAIQHVRTTPLILAAEVYENAPASHDRSATQVQGSQTTTAEQPAVEAAEWQPADGWQRTLSTTLTSILTGAGFAAMLAGISLLVGIPITTTNGAIWGLCGFLAVTLAPAAGLPPELPGMPAGDLMARKVWWLATIGATGLALYLIAARRELWAIAAAVVLIALPHLIGAPQPPTHESGVPAGLEAAFVTNSIAAGAIFWVIIGVFLGFALRKITKQVHAT